MKSFSEKLTQEFGEGYNVPNLKKMKKFYLTYKTGSTLWNQLSWSHNRLIMNIEDENKRNFYDVFVIENNENFIGELTINYKSHQLYELNEKSNEAIKYGNNNLIISHTDFDRKNVIWKDNIPFIIDWEVSGYINPTVELIQVAWYWSGGDVEKLDLRKFTTIVNSYKEYAKKEIDKNIEKLIHANLYNGLGWINYNFKRSLCIEHEYEQDEIELAEYEIVNSIEEIKYNVSQMNNMMNILKM